MKFSRVAAPTSATLLPVLLTVLLAACGTADAAAPHTASLPGDGHSHATLQVVTGTAALRQLLPRPRGDVPVRLAAGASQFLLSVPRGYRSG